jgi:hypothetical protein
MRAGRAERIDQLSVERSRKGPLPLQIGERGIVDRDDDDVVRRRRAADGEAGCDGAVLRAAQQPGDLSRERHGRRDERGQGESAH